MVARLWWKDARQFWPIWVLLAAVGLAAQGLILKYVGEEAHNGGLAIVALGWTCLYAFAIATAAFAGERENRTLHLLDSLPVERWRVWTGKASFAIVSTAALGLFLFLAAALATDQWKTFSPWWGLFTGAVVLFVVLGCSLFWSAVMSNALLAAVLGVLTVLLLIPAIDVFPQLDLVFNRAENFWTQHFYGFSLGVLALPASALLFIRSGPPRRPLIWREVQPLATKPAAAPGEVITSIPGRPRFWPAAVRSLTWQTLRELRSVWWWLALLCIVAPPCFYIGQQAPYGAWMFCLLAANIVAGISVFGIENRARTQVFLANEGVSPGLVWFIKTSIWLAAMGVLWVLTVLECVLFARLPLSFGPDPALTLLSFVGLLLITTTIPILCGMVIRRGITAATIALLLLTVLLPALSVPFALKMVPGVFVLLFPLVVLAVSFAWSRDWMIDRPGVGRWVRLAAFLAGFFGLLFAAYVAVRVLEVPVLEPARDAQLFTLTTPAKVPASDNAADLYRQLAKSNLSMPPVSTTWNGWDLQAENVIAWYHENASALELVRKASARPACRFTDLETETAFSVYSGRNGWDSDLRPLSTILPLVTLSILDHQARGDLDAAWQDLAVLFRISRQWSGAVPMDQAFTALGFEREALSRAMTWSIDSKQTSEQLRKALESYRKLPPMPDAAEPIRVLAQMFRNAERMPRAELLDRILDLRARDSQPSDLWTHKLWVDVMTTPWELARASKACRLLLASKIELSHLEPWYTEPQTGWKGNLWSKLTLNNGTPQQILAPASLQEIDESTPLVQTFFSYIDSYLDDQYRSETVRRAFVQVVALRIWQLEHHGRLPERLQELVTAHLLEVLPADPYTPGHQFGYVRSSGQPLLPLGDNKGPVHEGPGGFERLRPTPRSWLLYSVGPDRKDDDARSNETYGHGGDIIFPLEESTPGAKAGSPH